MGITSRRTFLQSTVAITAAALMGSPRLSAGSLHCPIGLQLYSLRQQLPKDFAGTLAQIRAAGYSEVEAAGYYDHKPDEFRHAVEQAGLRCVSTHHPMNLMVRNFDVILNAAHALGVEFLICASPQRRGPITVGPLNLDDWHWCAEQFNHMGEKAKDAGIRFGYHNHIHEFESGGGVTFYDELLRLTDPSLVCFEMDCGWTFAAGRDPLDYLLTSPGRFPLLHIKDMVKGSNGMFHSAVLGHGLMDYRPILKAATGLQHFFIEQEEFEIDPWEALRLDAAFMKKHGARSA